MTDTNTFTTSLSFSDCLEKYGEYGEVCDIKHMLVSASGLHSAKPEELVVFESGLIGQIFEINNNFVDILLFSHKRPQVGEKIALTNAFFCFPVGDKIIGKILNPMGKIIGGGDGKIDGEACAPVEAELLTMDKLKTIDKPLSTGTALVDLLLPIGMGQKELIVGDRKTGKTSFLLTLLQNHANSKNIIIYCLIGKKSTELKSTLKFLVEKQILEKMIVISATASDPTGLIYAAPFSAMTVAEYFCGKGKNVVLVLDDLTNHAKYYREISLLARRFPGRESYPGDIFHTHARLLERAGNFENAKTGEASITCFPVVETMESDLTGYIPTNLMGITDGHIFFDNNLFQKGRRPAINPFVSVTRVGKQTQNHLKKEIIQELTAFLTNYETLQGYVHFGAELSPQVQKKLMMGTAFESLFDQKQGNPINEEVQVILFGLIWGVFIETADVQNSKAKLIEKWKNIEERKKMEEIIKVENIKDLVERLRGYWGMQQ